MSNRRDFLKNTALAGGALLVTPTLSFGQSKNTDVETQSKFRTLGTGKHAITVAPVGLGCMGMSYHRSFIPDKKAMITMMRKSFEAGQNFYDTAEAYGPFLNEALVGEALVPFRKEIILATKFGFVNGKPSEGLDSRPERIRKVVENSLKSLRTDYIDLLYQHRIDPNVPIEDVAGTVKDLITEGKVRNFGMSERDFSQTKNGKDLIRKAHVIQPITAIQSEYSVMTRQPEKEVLNLCEELGIGFVPYSPLSRGLITGYINERTKYNADNDNRISLPRYNPEIIIANWPIIDVLKEFGDQKGFTVAQVALAWLLAQKPFIVPMAGTTKLAHLLENLGAVDLEFTQEELKSLTSKLSAIEIKGERYTSGYPTRNNK